MDPRPALSLIRPASITVSPACTAASVWKLRVLMRTLPLRSGIVPGVLTSCTISRNTMPSRVMRGRTFRVMPVARYCTWLTVSEPRPGVTVTEEIGISAPTLSSATALLRTKMDGVCNRRTSVTSSRAEMIAAASRPRKV